MWPGDFLESSFPLAPALLLVSDRRPGVGVGGGSLTTFQDLVLLMAKQGSTPMSVRPPRGGVTLSRFDPRIAPEKGSPQISEGKEQSHD